MSFPVFFGRSSSLRFLLLCCQMIWFCQGEGLPEYDCTGESSGVCRAPEECRDDYFTICPIPGSPCCPDPVGNVTRGDSLDVEMDDDNMDDEINARMDPTSRCRITPTCVSLGGFCATRKTDCVGKILKKECKGKKCFCCLPAVTQGKCHLTGLPGVVCEAPKTCAGYGTNLKGVYDICPISNCPPIKVRCMDDGWTVILYRNNTLKPRCNFARDWNDYKYGFCNASRDYWLGLEVVSALFPTYTTYKMQFGGATASGERRILKYSVFRIENEASKYRLYVDNFDSAGSTAPDQFESSRNSNLVLTGMSFTTYDRDNDNRANMNCAEFTEDGGWWFNSCTGLLVTKRSKLEWYYWTASEYGPVEVQEVFMRIKP